jgi:hypothetical protein
MMPNRDEEQLGKAGMKCAVSTYERFARPAKLQGPEPPPGPYTLEPETLQPETLSPETLQPETLAPERY